MPTFPKPKFEYSYTVQKEIAALRQHKATRASLRGSLTGMLNARPEKDFKAYCRYYISDHRPMWMEFKTA